MADLNTMMRDAAMNGLKSQLDAAVTNGDAEAARKVAADIAALEVSLAPKAPPYGDAEIRAELDKQPWFGVDPKKSGRVLALGKDMNPKKFPSAEAFAAALIKAIEDEDKPAPKAKDDDDDPKDDDDDPKGEDKAAVKRKTDAPGEGDALGRGNRAARSGPWAKISDAPADVQKEIKRSADKFAGNVTKEQREVFVTKALESHYAAHQRAKARK